MTVLSTATERGGYGQLLRENANFRNLWLGQVVSLLGDWFTLIGSATLIATLSGSGLAIGGLFIARTLPAFVLSPITGVIADRFDRRVLLILSDLSRALVALGFLLVRDAGHIWLLYALTVLQLSISALWQPTQTALLPEIVTKDKLVAANALLGTTWSTMLALGAALGGLATGLIGIYPAFIIDSATYVLSAYFMWRILYKAQPALTSGGLRDGIRQYTDGLRYLWGDSRVLVIALLKGVGALTVGGGLGVLQVRYAQQLFPIGEGGSISLGLMYAVIGVGTGLGPLVARRLVGDEQRAMRWTIVISFVMQAGAMVIVWLAPTLPVVLLGMTIRAVGGGIVWVFSTALLLLLVPEGVRGRVFAFDFAIFTLAYAVSTGLSGWLLDASTWNDRFLALALGGTALAAGVLLALWEVRQSGRKAPEPAEAVHSA